VGGGKVVDDLVVAGGDATGFDDWIRPHLATLIAVAERQVGFAYRDDVVQETILRAWRRRSTYRSDKGTVRVWLLGILMDQTRRHRTRHRQDLAIGDHEPAPATPPNDSDDVDAAIARLPKRQREVVLLYYLADLSITDVGRALNISDSAVTSHLSSARLHLANELGDTYGS
jgi:RNA polymerase sigma factor (sigma-70 family)